MIHYLWVGAGGFLGSLLRAAFSSWMQSTVRATGSLAGFPAGTLAVNVLGCLLLGGTARWLELQATGWTHARAFLVVGVLGGFTTFSAFGYESFELWRNSQRALACANIALQVVLGVAAVALGYWTLGGRGR